MSQAEQLIDSAREATKDAGQAFEQFVESANKRAGNPMGRDDGPPWVAIALLALVVVAVITLAKRAAPPDDDEWL